MEGKRRRFEGNRLHLADITNRGGTFFLHIWQQLAKENQASFARNSVGGGMVWVGPIGRPLIQKKLIFVVWVNICSGWVGGCLEAQDPFTPL